jgi:hypothetical protein
MRFKRREHPITKVRVPPQMNYRFSERAIGGAMSLVLFNDSDRSEFVVTRIEGIGFMIRMREVEPLISKKGWVRHGH